VGKKKEQFSCENLQRMFEETDARTLDVHRRYVIFSDLHMGNGGKADDFVHNSSLFNAALARYYLPNEYDLILNGDVEELARYNLAAIMKRWGSTYDLFDHFKQRNALHRLVGNHDMHVMESHDDRFDIRDAIRFTYKGNTIFIFHGHQSSLFYSRHNRWIDMVLRYVANPLRIRSYTISHDSQKRFAMEKRVYQFASSNKILSIVAHTHRPLFESMNKSDSIKFEIETLCRSYSDVEIGRKTEIEERIKVLKADLHNLMDDPDHQEQEDSLYNANLLVPCMFNSGCVLGKHGMTCLEIENGELRLVYWFDSRRSKRYLRYRRYGAEQIEGEPFYRVVLKRDSLDYIFSRIRLLA
jgi:predicted phosphodiesterase